MAITSRLIQYRAAAGVATVAGLSLLGLGLAGSAAAHTSAASAVVTCGISTWTAHVTVANSPDSKAGPAIISGTGTGLDGRTLAAGGGDAVINISQPLSVDRLVVRGALTWPKSHFTARFQTEASSAVCSGQGGALPLATDVTNTVVVTETVVETDTLYVTNAVTETQTQIVFRTSFVPFTITVTNTANVTSTRFVTDTASVTETVTDTAPGGTVTRTLINPGSTATVTQTLIDPASTATVTVGGPGVTKTVTKTVAPTKTVTRTLVDPASTATVTRTLIDAGSTATVTVTKTRTKTVSAPAVIAQGASFGYVTAGKSSSPTSVAGGALSLIGLLGLFGARKAARPRHR